MDRNRFLGPMPIAGACVVVIIVGLFVGFQTWWDEESRPDYRELSSKRFDDSIVPPPFEFQEVHAADASNSVPTLVYASFSGPADRSRVTFQIHDHHSDALEVLGEIRELAGARVDETVNATQEESLCVQDVNPSLFECYAPVGRVMVRGDVLLDEPDQKQGTSLASKLLEVGIRHLDSFN